MKKSPNLPSLVIASAVAACSFLVVANADAQLARSFRRGLGSVERADASPSKAASVGAESARPAVSPEAAAGTEAARKSYPRYRLIDLGTLGGENAYTVLPAVTLNDRGENIAQESTGRPDPFPDTPLQDDGTIWHAVLTTGNGVVRDLGGLGGNHSLPTWISENGLITGLGENGLFDDAGGFAQLRALFWDTRRILHDLGTLGGNTSQGNAVNNVGQVVGISTNRQPENPDVATYFNGSIPAGQQVRAFLWQRGAMRDLGTLGGNDASATAINDDGDTTGLPTVHPFLWKNGRTRDLGTLGGTLATTGSFVFGPFGHILNERGQVTGTSMLAGDDTFHAFFWDKKQMIDLGTLGVRNSEAFFLSDKGEVLGRAEVSLTPYVRHGFLWEKGRLTDLGAPAPCTRSTPLALNSKGQIVGNAAACVDDPNARGYFTTFYEEKGKPPVDLHSLITPATSIQLEDASYINERGEISAGGLAPDGTKHAVLLVPIK